MYFAFLLYSGILLQGIRAASSLPTQLGERHKDVLQRGLRQGVLLYLELHARALHRRKQRWQVQLLRRAAASCEDLN